MKIHGLKVLIEIQEIFEELFKFIELRRSIVCIKGHSLFICYFLVLKLMRNYIKWSIVSSRPKVFII